MTWMSYCDTGTCIETRTVDDQVEIRDSQHPDATLLVPAEAWEQFLGEIEARAVARAVADARTEGDPA